MHSRETAPSLRKGAEFALQAYCRRFEINGQSKLEKIDQILEQDPEAKFIIAASHFADLDVPSAIKTFGGHLDMQITAESNLFDRLTPQREVLMRLMGVENFSPLAYNKTSTGKRGIFDPDDFTKLEKQISDGKSPWIAVHPFTLANQMEKAGIGAVYLAQETKSFIIPAATEIRGNNPKTHRLSGLMKGLIDKPEIIYHVGDPIKLEPLDITPIRIVLENRKRKIKPTPAEMTAFREVHRKLKEQAEQVAETVAAMLPPEQQGAYRGNK